MAGYPRRRESDIKAKIEGYTSVPNEQAHHRSKGSAEQMRYAEKKLEEIVNAGLENRGDYEDWCDGINFIKPSMMDASRKVILC